MKTILMATILAIGVTSVQAKSLNCRKEAIETARTKAFSGKKLVFAKLVYGPNDTEDEVYLVKFQTKSDISDAIDSDLVAVSLSAEEASGCNVHEAALMMNHTP